MGPGFLAGRERGSRRLTRSLRHSSESGHASALLSCNSLPQPGVRLRLAAALAGLAELALAGAGLPWTLRGLHARTAVTEALAGAAGPGRAVSGAGPSVEAIRLAEIDAPQPWRLVDIVSAAHLIHYPGRGWSPASAGTDALPSLGVEVGRGSRRQSGYPFGDDYVFGAARAVSGWADAAHAALWPALWKRADCPPSGRPDGSHDVALALALAGDAGVGRRLAHSGYGWWTVAPVGSFPWRIAATLAGLSFGAPATGTPEAGAEWRGRLTGHLFRGLRRWAAAGDVLLKLLPGSGAMRLTGHVENLVLARLDSKSLEPVAEARECLAAISLGAGPDKDGSWSGPLILNQSDGLVDVIPVTDSLQGDWRATAHGPGGTELAGRLRLWTPLTEGAEAAIGWPGQTVLAAGFGAARTP